jgi:ATP-dependent Clp protease ATP-binding subunit ClpA
VGWRRRGDGAWDRAKDSQEADRKFNKHLTDRGVTIELDESLKELILVEGFSKEDRARNLERVVDRMQRTLIAEALLGEKISEGQVIHLVANEDWIRFLTVEGLYGHPKALDHDA